MFPVPMHVCLHQVPVSQQSLWEYDTENPTEKYHWNHTGNLYKRKLTLKFSNNHAEILSVIQDCRVCIITVRLTLYFNKIIISNLGNLSFVPSCIFSMIVFSVWFSMSYSPNILNKELCIQLRFKRNIQPVQWAHIEYPHLNN